MLGLILACGWPAIGCIPYLSHPTMDYTPAVKLPEKRPDVHAFRVDITKSTHDLRFFEGNVNERLIELPVTHEDQIGPQFKAGVTRGLVIIGVALNYVTQTSDSLALRIYRPGYETVEIRSWERVNEVIWVPADSLVAREAALDKLLPQGLARKPKTLANTQALEFVAGEYQRLLEGAPDSESRKRLEEKLTNLRRLFEVKEAIM